MRKARARQNFARAGMTLIEIMIVVALLAGLMVIAAVGFGVIGQTDVAGESLRMSAAVRYTFNMAATSNMTLQMKIDFDEQTFEVDKLDVEGGLSEEVLSGTTMRNEASQSLGREKMMDDEDARFGTVQREALDGMFISGEDAKLGDGVYFLGLMTSHHSEEQVEGMGTINFFASGFVERSVIFLGDEAAKNGEEGGVIYSIAINPLTGQSVITPGKLDLGEKFFEEEEDN
ncbi:MAG: prepilin-type N-terminal cleavage/methylation domain-containing protein [Bradymonadales bacterium]|jgi:prepilin-type N-terminal cleavage/methylation domain-containing protein